MARALAFLIVAFVGTCIASCDAGGLIIAEVIPNDAGADAETASSSTGAGGAGGASGDGGAGGEITMPLFDGGPLCNGNGGSGTCSVDADCPDDDGCSYAFVCQFVPGEDLKKCVPIPNE
jgi:hypothetical protein